MRLATRSFLSVLLLCSSVLSALQLTASVEGKVQTEDGKPVPNALVVVMPSSPAADAAKFSVHSAMTAEDGNYKVEGPGLGSYVVCVQPADEELLSSCRWTVGARQLTLAAAGKTQGVDLALARGVVLRFRVDDPEGVLPRAAKPEAAGIFLPGVWTKQGLFEPAQLRSDDEQGIDFILTVPRGEDLLPYVDARNARILGTDGSLHKASSLAKIRFDSSERERRFYFRVTGPEVRREAEEKAK